MYAGHVNYYFGKEAHGRVNKERYEHMLEMLPKLGHTAIIMTAPVESDYYKLIEENPFSAFACSEFVADFFRKKGCNVSIVNTPIRFYVAHAFKSEHEAVVLWRFFNDTQEMPKKEQLEKFLNRVRAVIDATGHVNIKDQLIIVSQQ